MSVGRQSPKKTEAPSLAGNGTCRNCGAPAPGKYCSECGQTTSTDVPTVAQFIHEFIARYAAREGHIWKTLSKLFFAPGELTIDYIAGARQRSLRPLQLYLAASVIVFAVAQIYGLNLTLRLFGDHGIHLIRGTPVSGEDENSLSSRLLPIQLILDHVDTAKVRRFGSMSVEERFKFLRARRVQYISSFVLFLVPLFALILKFSYRSRRRRYGEHLIFGLHTHSFALFILLLETLVPAILADILSLWLVVYFLVALKRVYGGTWAESLVRGTMLGALYFATYFVGNLLLIFALLEL